jgi:hypothetical protein
VARWRAGAAVGIALAAVMAFGVAGARAGDAPVDVTPPQIVGSASDTGILLAVIPGTWTGSPTFTYQWEQCDGAGSGCSPISGATGFAYTTVLGDEGHVIQADVTGTNADGATTANAQTPGPVGPPTLATAGPIVGDTSTAGGVLTALSSSWNEWPSVAYQWQRCDGAGASCIDIASATSSQYTTVSADLGHVLQATTIATNIYGTADGTAQTASAIGAPTPLSVPPEIDGDVSAAGKVLTLSNGDWTESPTSFAYQWQRCDGGGASCVAIDGATANTYTTQSADLGHVLGAVVTATNGYGSTAQAAIQTLVIGAPQILGHAPAISGDATAVGNVLTVSTGDWTGSPTLAYAWYRCDADGNNCAPIDGATANAYTIVADDLGHVLEVVVTASNAYGSATWPAELLFPAGAPQLTGGFLTAPQISGDASTAGNVLTVSDGTWYGAPTITYQWQLCNANGSACADIGGATDPTYTIQSGDLGHVVHATVTATNGFGASSYQTSVFIGLPANATPPQITGDASAAGNVLTVTDGTWGGAPTFTYQWYRCNSFGGSCAAIDGETASTYTIEVADEGHVLEADVTATNAYGANTATAQVLAASNAPSIADFDFPAISGDTSSAGNVFSVTDGTWTHSPTSFVYRWERCSDAFGDTCSDIGGATASTYTTQAADLGFYLEAVVTASNADGSTDAGTSVVGPIGAPTIADFDFPHISGDTSAVGTDLTVSTGTWTGSPTLAYQWQRCDADGTNCADISGATANAYTTQTGDLGHTLEAHVIATNAYGATTQLTGTTGVVGAPTIVDFDDPQISGDIGGAGNVLTVSDGTWTGSPAFTYQWQRCDGDGLSCVDIDGATSNTYTIQDADLGHLLAADVTATTAGGTTTVAASTFYAVGSPQVVGFDFPSIGGDAGGAGDVLTVGTGTWSGSPTFTYQWRRCDADGLNCTAIGGATSDTYTIVEADLGHVLAAQVTATNTYGAVTSSTQSSVVGLPSIVDFDEPTISGDASVAGNVLTVSTGTWTGSPTFTYQWGRCDTAGSNCVDIDGATASTYTIANADLGHVLQATVTATGSAGSNYAFAQTGVLGFPEILDFDYPSISGDTSAPGNVLTVSPGTWTGSPTIAYQWERCDADGFSNCATIGGATASTYTIVSADLGHRLRVAVSATNAYGVDTEHAVTSETVGAPAIVDFDYPRLSGDDTAVGNVLTISSGTWTGSPTLTYAWERCDADGFSNCAAIDGATANTYTIQAADVGHMLEAIVTATNANGSSSAGDETGFIVGAPQVVGTEPLIGGDETVAGKTLVVSSGTWSGSPTFAYQWERCNSDGVDCEPIDGATTHAYTTEPADLGHYLEARVIATNAGGSTTWFAETSWAIGAPELLGGFAQITGDASAAGKTLTVVSAWNGSPTLTYEWLRCAADGSDCTPISGENAGTHTIVTADLEHELFAVVTATNASGSTSVQAAVLVGAPSNVALPTITGDIGAVGNKLTVSNGTWHGNPTSFARQWYRCTADGASCDAIDGATGTTYTIASADAGHALFAGVTATNAAGSTEADSVTTAVVATGATQHLLSVSFSGSGAGGVTSSPGGISCNTSCSAEFSTGTTVILTPATASGSTFTGWSGGGCSGTGGCSITVTADTRVTATFVASPAAPTIASFSPTGAGAHSTVTVTGTNLTFTNAVTLGGDPVPFHVVSATTLTFSVPAGSAGGTIAITTTSGTVTSAGALTILAPPAIASIDQTSGPVGTVVTITGTNLAGVVAIQIGHVVVVPTSVSPNAVTFIIPAGATSGSITVLSPAGSATSADSFTVTP